MAVCGSDFAMWSLLSHMSFMRCGLPSCLPYHSFEVSLRIFPLQMDGATLKQLFLDFASASHVMGRNEADQCVKMAVVSSHFLREEAEMVARPAQS